MSKDPVHIDIQHFRDKLEKIEDKTSPAAITLIKQIELLEDAVIIYRLSQSEPVQTFIIDNKEDK